MKHEFDIAALVDDSPSQIWLCLGLAVDGVD